MNFLTADVYDAAPEQARVCTLDFRNYGGKSAFWGQCVTLRSNSHRPGGQILATPGSSRVLIIDGGGTSSFALLGATMAANAVRNDWAGVIVCGAIRDTPELCLLDLGIKALGTSPALSTAFIDHTRDVPVTFGGVTFNPGDWVYADHDGVVVRSTPCVLGQGHPDQANY